MSVFRGGSKRALGVCAVWVIGCGNASPGPSTPQAAGAGGVLDSAAGAAGRSGVAGAPAPSGGNAGSLGSGSAGGDAGASPGGSAGSMSPPGGAGPTAGASGGASSSGGAGGDGPACSDGCPTKNVSQLATHTGHACALLTDFRVKCWGVGGDGSLGLSQRDMASGGLDSWPAVTVSPDPTLHATQLAVGANHSCARLSNGTLACWGANFDGQCGNAVKDNNSSISWLPGPISVSSTPNVSVAQVAAGWKHTCVVLSTGGVECWGNNEYSQLGYGHLKNIGDDELPSSVGPVSVTSEAGVKVTQLVAGFRHTCALLSTGGVKCWGSNDVGQVGLGHYVALEDQKPPSNYPDVSVTTTAGVKVVQLAAGAVHTCALLSDGSVRCWGAWPAVGLPVAPNPQIGDDELPSSVPAVNVGLPPGTSVTQISAASLHTCVRFSNGTAKCWGDNTRGALGYGIAKQTVDVPSSVSTLSVATGSVTVASIHASSGGACAILSDGSAKCWGSSAEGILGQNTLSATNPNGDIGDDELPSTLPSLKLF